MKSHKIKVLTVVLAAIIVVVLAIHNVPKTITAEDKEAIAQILSKTMSLEARSKKPEDFGGQLQDILHVQDAIFRTAPDQQEIPRNQEREPQNLLKEGHGYCFDRARTLDKALRYLGYETRYAAIYGSKTDEFNPWLILTAKGGKANGGVIFSHAIVEVKTAKGWMAIDTVNDWIGMDRTGKVYSLKDLEAVVKNREDAVEWSLQNSDPIYPLIAHKFTPIYGFYSRHGHAYKPYNPIPDVNWGEVLHNIYKD